MTRKSRPGPHAAPETPAVDDSLRERWSAAQAALLSRFDQPIDRAARITQRTLGWFPIRVWRHFLQHNGFLLAAGVSYQSLFTIFAAIYVGFAAIGIWLGGDDQAVDQLIAIINLYIPNLISDGGLVTPRQVEEITSQSGSTTLAITGAVALVVAIWTAIGFVTYARRAVRDIFGLPFDRRSYVLLKTRDLVAAIAFGLSLLVGWALVQVTVWALDVTLSLAGMLPGSAGTEAAVRALTLFVAFGINAVALAALVRYMTGTSLRWARIWPGSLLGGGAMAVLQVGAGLLLAYTPSNPLLATFAIFVGFLLWFRINGIVILVAAAWIAVATADRDLPLVELSEWERVRQEHDALVAAARIRVRRARARRDGAPWWRRPQRERDLARAERELAALEAEALPPLPAHRFLD